MSQQSRSNECFASPRWAHSSYKYNIYKILKWFFLILVIIPSLLIYHLSNNFNRRLSPPGLSCRHIQVIYKHNSFAYLRSIHSSSPTVQSTINNLLCLGASSLCTEPYFYWLVYISIQSIRQKVFNVDTFTCASGSTKQGGVFIQNVYFQQVSVTHCVYCLHHYFLGLYFGWNLFTGVNQVNPLDPFPSSGPFANHKLIVIYLSSIRNAWHFPFPFIFYHCVNIS